jgi:hypothetical protein
LQKYFFGAVITKGIVFGQKEQKTKKSEARAKLQIPFFSKT